MKQCAACDSTTTYITTRGFEQWHIHDGFRLCQKCYDFYVWCPVNSDITHIRNDPKRILFGGKRIILKERPRKGICLWCGKEGLTHIHHIEYHEDDPLKDTVELCPSCHAKESNRLGQVNYDKSSFW